MILQTILPTLRCCLLAGAAVLLALAGAGHVLAQEPIVLRDVNPGEASSNAADFVRYRGALYFRADDGEHGFELWRTDGTAEGTELAVDLTPGAPGGFPTNVTAVRGQLYFTAYDTPEAVGSKVFQSDGTKAGTQLLVDTFPGLPANPFGPPLPNNFTPLRNLVLFTATDPEAGNELWRTDGTPEGTTRVIDLHPGIQWSVPVGLTPYRGVAIFAADDSVVVNPDGTATFNRELFRTDGTAAGTVRIKDIYPGPLPSTPIGFTRFAGRLFFIAMDPTAGREVWRTDGTAAGTVGVTDVNPGPADAFPQDLTRLRRSLIFSATDAATGFEPWRTRGFAQATRQIEDVNPAGPSNPLYFTPVGPRAFFTADDGEHGTELWITNGTAFGTRLVKDINPGPELSSPLDLTVVGHEVYFAIVRQSGLGDGSVFTELWKSNGTEAGTQLVWAAPGRSFGYSITDLTRLGNQLIFVAPTDVDANGLSIDYEPYALRVGLLDLP